MLANILLLLSLGLVSGLYEDQVFKFDWRQRYIGKLKDLVVHPTSLDPLFFVSTDRNVVAALDSDSGKIIWRHKFEEDDLEGEIRAIGTTSKHVMSASGGGPSVYIRIWEPVKGYLIQEHFLRLKQRPDLVSFGKQRLFVANYQPQTKTIQVIKQGFDSKKLSAEPTTLTIKVSEFAGHDWNCALQGAVLVCSEPQRGLYWLDINESMEKRTVSMQHLAYPEEVAQLNAQVDSTSLRLKANSVEVDLNVSGDVSRAVLRYQIKEATGGPVKIQQGEIVKAADHANAWWQHISTGCLDGQAVVQACKEVGVDSDGLKYCSEFAKEMKVVDNNNQEVALSLNEKRGRVEKVWAECGAEADKFQLVLLMEDASLYSFTPLGNVIFQREEGLTGIENVQMVSMGNQNKGELKMALHNHHTLDPVSLIHSFLNRLKRHSQLIQNSITSLLNSLLKNGVSSASKANKNVAPDRFGLRKVIVAVTKHNKMYGLDSMSGNVLWKVMFPGRFDPNHPKHRAQSFLLVQKDGVMGDYAEAALIYHHARSVHYMMIFDPLTGKIRENRPIPLQLDQALLLPESPEHELKPILLVGKDGRAIIHPSNAIDCIRDGPPIYIATAPKGSLVGNRLSVQSNGDLSLLPVWNLLSQSGDIVAISTRHPDERVHSAGRVLADRSVLFKYMNPNLALILAAGEMETQGKYFINVYLVDLVTGRLFFTANHKRVLPPFHAVHSENWAVYTYFNDKARRTELVSLELYEGKNQMNSTAFSSIESSVNPMVERQAFILSTSDITALRDTITEQGITCKHLLIGMATGAILDLPIHMVDPRRPALDTPPHLREPGIMPYIPELKIASENILNYNQTILGVKGITTSPSGLESTTLVFIHGLDLYGTRITPSKGFDLLKDDFDYEMIFSVMFGLVMACHFTRQFAHKKQVSMAWK